VTAREPRVGYFGASLWTTMPDLKVVVPRSSRWLTSWPSNRRVPVPAMTGKIQKWYSSTSLFSSRVRENEPVPNVRMF